jgi:hypothetical protein
MATFAESGHRATNLWNVSIVLSAIMNHLKIDPYSHRRWLRLLFTREFSMSDALKLWDCLFACDASLDLAQWVCVAMLIRIRNERTRFLSFQITIIHS